MFLEALAKCLPIVFKCMQPSDHQILFLPCFLSTSVFKWVHLVPSMAASTIKLFPSITPVLMEKKKILGLVSIFHFFLFSIVGVTNYHKVNGLKKHNLLCCSSVVQESYTALTWIRSRQGRITFWRVYWRIYFFAINFPHFMAPLLHLKGKPGQFFLMPPSLWVSKF